MVFDGRVGLGSASALVLAVECGASTIAVDVELASIPKGKKVQNVTVTAASVVPKLRHAAYRSERHHSRR